MIGRLARHDRYKGHILKPLRFSRHSLTTFLGNILRTFFINETKMFGLICKEFNIFSILNISNWNTKLAFFIRGWTLQYPQGEGGITCTYIFSNSYTFWLKLFFRLLLSVILILLFSSWDDTFTIQLSLLDFISSRLYMYAYRFTFIQLISRNRIRFKLLTEVMCTWQSSTPATLSNCLLVTWLTSGVDKLVCMWLWSNSIPVILVCLWPSSISAPVRSVWVLASFWETGWCCSEVLDNIQSIDSPRLP